MKQTPIYALTSLSPSPGRAAIQKRCVQSWRDAGLQVRSFNHPFEMSQLAQFTDVEFVPVANPISDSDGRSFVPINAMLDWAADADAPVLIINADIELRLPHSALKRLRWLADGGLCYFIRHNHDGDVARARPEPYGIDAFLLHGRDAALFPRSSLSMGQPFWDYWIPYTMMRNDRAIFSVESPVAFHLNHPQQWSWQTWHRSALEFDRMNRVLGGDRSLNACHTMALRTRDLFHSRKKIIAPQPLDIRQWVQSTFSTRASKIFLELGCHSGSDTAWMCRLPSVTIHAFEPDPRNCPPALPNVTIHRAAIADRDGTVPFILSKEGWGQQWTHSSSIKAPKNHLKRYPVTFGDRIEVCTVSLDTFCRHHNFPAIDFIWADIQGAEGEMIRGGRDTLSRTRYLFTEYSDEELYEGQVTLEDILDLLPGFHIVELWPDDVLLENHSL